MQAQATLKELTIEQTVEQILTSHKITRNEQRWLISLCLKGGLSYQQDNLINQVYEVLRQGLLIVVDWTNRGISTYNQDFHRASSCLKFDETNS